MGETAACEQHVDYAATAELMMEAFGLGRPVSQARLEWLYDRAFSFGTTVVALHDGNSKIGQIALVRQMLQLNGRRETAAQLVDLFL